MSKKKLLWIGDCVIPSGFGRVSESILTRIHKEFDTHVMGINYFGQVHTFDFKVYPASKNGGAQDPYGFNYIEELYNEIKPDIIVAFNDVWIIKFYWDILKKYKETDNFKFVAYFPIDGGGWFPSVVSFLNDFDLSITYTNFGVNVMKDAGYTGRIETLEHGVDTDIFFRKNKQECREPLVK